MLLGFYIYLSTKTLLILITSD